jgi:hypothetical protein
VAAASDLLEAIGCRLMLLRAQETPFRNDR